MDLELSDAVYFIVFFAWILSVWILSRLTEVRVSDKMGRDSLIWWVNAMAYLGLGEFEQQIG